MKAVQVLALTLLVAYSASAQAERPYEIGSQYDKFKDVTTVALKPMHVEDTRTALHPVFMLAMFYCPGQSNCKPDAVYLGFFIVDGTEAYTGQGVARMIRDGVRQDPYKLKYVGMVPGDLTIPFTTQGFMAMIRPEGLVKIANSKSVEYQIDSFEFTLTPDNLAGLRALASRMQ